MFQTFFKCDLMWFPPTSIHILALLIMFLAALFISIYLILFYVIHPLGDLHFQVIDTVRGIYIHLTFDEETITGR